MYSYNKRREAWHLYMQRTVSSQYSRLSPMLQVSKTPVSGRSFQAMACLSTRGGSRTSSSVSTQVPVIVSKLIHEKASTRLTPMNAKRFLALCVNEDVDTVKGIGVHGRHDIARIICSNRDQPQIEGSSVFANLLEGRTCRVGVLFIIVVLFFWKIGHRSVTSVSSEPDLFAAALDAP
jgi:hypothetical protein